MKKVSVSLDHVFEAFDGSTFLTEKQCEKQDELVLQNDIANIYNALSVKNGFSAPIAAALMKKYNIQPK